MHAPLLTYLCNALCPVRVECVCVCVCESVGHLCMLTVKNQRVCAPQGLPSSVGLCFVCRSCHLCMHPTFAGCVCLCVCVCVCVCVCACVCVCVRVCCVCVCVCVCVLRRCNCVRSGQLCKRTAVSEERPHAFPVTVCSFAWDGSEGNTTTKPSGCIPLLGMNTKEKQ